MKKFLSIVILSLVMSSCLTEAKIARNCERFAKVCGKTESVYTHTKDTTIYVNDTVLVKLPADTVRMTDTLTIENGIVSSKPVTKSFGLVSATAFVLNNRLDVTAWINKPSMLIPRVDTVFIPGAIRETVINKVIPVKYVPKVFKWAFGIVLAQIVLVILVLLKKFNIFNPISLLAKLVGK